MLAPGSRIGPHEIVAPLGAGGMGEVYRAHDGRLGRDVAVKVLPPALAADPDRLKRFEQEARAAGALSHPNLLTVFDVGLHEGGPYIVFELLRGATLRQVLDKGAPPLRKALDYGAQIAHGLAAAHEQGIVHRDLKPDNLFVTDDGRVKILDFGLAKLVRALDGGVRSEEATASEITDAGAVVGTVGYMSPEQVQGQAADHRSDVFALGCVLYELISGRRAFKGDSAVETLHAILKEDPPELSGTVALPPALGRIVGRCLEKDPDERFQSARDLAFALQALSGSGVVAPVRRRRTRSLVVAAGVLGLISLALASRYALSRRVSRVAALSFEQLTFRQGAIHSARFGPGGTIFYSAHWSGREDDVFFTRPGNPEGRALGFEDVQVVSLSASGELAVILNARSDAKRTLARLTFPGGAPRELASDVTDADWSPAGQDLATVRGFHTRLEFPPGTVLFESKAPTIGPIRFSPRGDRIAFFERNTESGARPSGTLWSVDLAGNKTRLFAGVMEAEDGLAWSADGHELWFVSRTEAGEGSVLRAIDARARVRDIHVFDGWVGLKDVGSNGDLLLSRVLFQKGMVVIDRDGKAQDQTWLNRSAIADISEDARTIVFTERVRESPFVCVRRRDAADAIRLGEGEAKALSPDGDWVLGISKETFVLYPLGPGKSRTLPMAGVEPPFDIHWAAFFPGGKRLVVSIQFATGSRLYTLDLENGKVEPLSPEGQFLGTSMTHPFSPDGRRMLAHNGNAYGLYSLVDGRFEDVGLAGDELPIRWSSDGRHVFYRGPRDERLIYRLDLQTLRKELWKELPRSDTLSQVAWVVTTGDGKAVAYSYNREQADLYLVKGLR